MAKLFFQRFALQGFGLVIQPQLAIDATHRLHQTRSDGGIGEGRRANPCRALVE